MIAFGAGSRTCIGVNLAYMEFRCATALFFRQCQGSKLDSTAIPQSIDLLNFFLVTPKCGNWEITMDSVDT